MSQYLKRLATRNLNGSAAMTPMARATSPIAEEDQRVGMHGFEDSQFGAAAVAGGELKDMSGSASDLSGVVQRKINTPVSEGKSAPRNFTNAGQPVKGDERSAGPSPAEIPSSNLDVPRRHFYERAQAPGQRFDEVVVNSHSQATGLPQSGGERIVAGEVMPTADPPAYWTAGLRPTPTFSYGTEAGTEGGAESDEIEASGPRLRRPSVAGPQLLEPSPRAITSQQQRGSVFPDDDTSSGETEPSPRVVIGRINVEVAPPPVEPKTSATSRPGPLTAESVSVIGPLSRGVRSNLRLSLKHR
jgi:hypothetical protein